ncbi:hypothetical protein KSD_70990 [Ktedonobacter sp. SOSP1-85]|uniref:HEAT repeat domain-containing protein n=1 Tax=Ktedonobacter sp. SOSP1-85 TaxID=2778367 RepID=UPI0019157D86|nr:hypothetical protein [Ktedonobacter sp. SOSP1-85]GHO79328.1 hypothetical protein KSD_70990 [Ktedonobacter sp. SOSP1-85]
MPQIDIPDAFIQAAILVHLDEDIDNTARVFYQEWKGATPEIIARILQKTEKVFLSDRVFALAILAYLAFPEAPALLRPFLHSPNRAERWVSTIALALLKEPAAFPLLQRLLLEDLLNPRAYKDASYFDHYWHMGRRYDIALLLGDWGNPTAIPVLCEAIQQCRAYEVDPDTYWGESSDILQDYRLCLEDYLLLLDRLAFALGCLKVHDALTTLSLPPAHWSYVQIYFLFGTLHIPGSHSYPTFVWPPVREQNDGTLEIPHIPLPHVLQALETHFHFSQEEQIAFLHQVKRARAERYDECYPYNTPGYKERFEIFDDLMGPF